MGSHGSYFICGVYFELKIFSSSMLTDRIVTTLFYRILDKFLKPVIGESRESIIFLFTIFTPAEVYSFLK